MGRAMLVGLGVVACSIILTIFAGAVGVSVGVPSWFRGELQTAVILVLGAFSFAAAAYGYLTYRRTGNRLLLIGLIPLVSVLAFALLLAMRGELERIQSFMMVYAPFSQ